MYVSFKCANVAIPGTQQALADISSERACSCRVTLLKHHTCRTEWQANMHCQG